MRSLIQWLRRSFIAGFFVTIPLVVSVVALVWAFRFADRVTSAVGRQLFGTPWPGLGLIVTAGAMLAIGAVATNVLGRRLFDKSEHLLMHPPKKHILVLNLQHVKISLQRDMKCKRRRN